MTTEDIKHKHYVEENLRNAQSWADYIEDDSIRKHVWHTIQACIEEVNSSF